MKVLDSFAWFEYFSGSAAGKKVQKILESSERVCTPVICLTEIKRKRNREGKSWQKELAFIEARGRLLPVTKEIALSAGDILEVHFADALIYATVLEHKAVLVTGDRHFKGLPYVDYLG